MFVTVAIILQILRERAIRLESFHLGRTSTLNLMSDHSLNVCSEETTKSVKKYVKYLGDPSIDLCLEETTKSVKNYAKCATKLTDIVKPTFPGSIVSGDKEISGRNQKCTLNLM